MSVFQELQSYSVQTFTGNGRCCVRDGGVGQGSLATPRNICVAPNGDLLISDAFAYGLRVVRQQTGEIQTMSFFGDGKTGTKAGFQIGDFCFSPEQPQMLYFTDMLHNKIRRFNVEQGKLNVLAGQQSGMKDGFITDALFKQPKALAFCCQGKILLVGDGNGLVRAIDLQDGEVSTLAGTPQTV